MLLNFIFRSQIGVSNKNLFTYVILITPYERFSANNHLINQQTPREPKLSQIYQRGLRDTTQRFNEIKTHKMSPSRGCCYQLNDFYRINFDSL